MHHHRLRGGLLGASVLLLALMAAVGPARADSVVYIKDANVWIANTDGSGARQFTLYQYGWAWPSEDDNGNVVAAGGLSRVNADGTDADAGSEIYRFRGDGNQIGAAIPTWGSYSSPSCPTYPPTGVRVSPDGSKVAYGQTLCATSEPTAMWTPSDSTGLNFPNQTLGQQDFTQPAWIDNDHFLVTHAGQTISDTQNMWYVHATGDGDNVGPGWYESSMTGTGFQGLINRQGTRLAVFENDAAGYIDGKPRNVTLWIYSQTSLAEAEAHAWPSHCTLSLDASKIPAPLNLSPSFSPDGTKLMWGDADGVKVASVASPDSSGACTTVNPVTLIPGGSMPFYAKGNVQAAAANPNQPGKPADLKPQAKFTLTTKKPRRGHKIVFDAGKSTEAGGAIKSYAWSFGDGKKGKGRRVTHKYRKAKTYKVTLTVRDAAGTTAKVTHKVKVRR